MKILVFIKEVPDVRIPVECNEATGRLRRDWGITMLNPSDRTALETALKIKADIRGARITIVHLGPPPHSTISGEASGSASSGKALPSDAMRGCASGKKVSTEFTRPQKPSSLPVLRKSWTSISYSREIEARIRVADKSVCSLHPVCRSPASVL